MTLPTNPPLLAAAPYPGLRPFHRGEADVFFGRDEQVDQLLHRLQETRFLAVVGPSGCGKSSLVRAGLLPALDTGFMATAGARWRVAVMRPGSRPLHALAEALLETGALGEAWDDLDGAATFLEASLARGPRGLIEVLESALRPERTSLLLLVDQFEEIFRFREEGETNEARALIDLLLATSAAIELDTYLVITMRSDYIGKCAVFTGLPEALNQGQYLTPRLTRAQCRASIEGPANVFGASVEPALINRILNDVGSDPDQLPLMQHALMRTWMEATKRNPAQPDAWRGDLEMTIEDYDAVGGMQRALSNHIDDAYDELSPDDQRTAEVMFRCLCQGGHEHGDTRRPISVDEVRRVADVAEADVIRVVEVFRREDRSFIMPPVGVALTKDTVLDISHESLIRQWGRLVDWLEDETRSGEIYRRLKEKARLWRLDQEPLLESPALEIAQAWRQGPLISRAWAARYDRLEQDDEPDAPAMFEQADEYLALSVEAAEEKRRAEAQQRQTERELELQKKVTDAERSRANMAEARKKSFVMWGLIATTLAVIGIGLAITAILARLGALEALKAAEVAKEEAELATAEEASARQTAQINLEAAEEQSRAARANRLAVQSAMARSSDWERSVLLAVEATRATEQDGRVEAQAEQALRDALEGRFSRRLAGNESSFTALAISPDNNTLATGSNDGTIRLWRLDANDPASSSIPLRGHSEAVTQLLFTPEGASLISVSLDDTARIWSTHRGAPRGEEGPRDVVLTLAHDVFEESESYPAAIDAKGGWLAIGGNETRVWNLREASPRPHTVSHYLSTAVGFGPGVLVIGHWSGGVEALEWPLPGRPVDELRGDVPNSIRLAEGLEGGSEVSVVAAHPDRRFVAAGARNGVVRLWRVDTTAPAEPGRRSLRANELAPLRHHAGAQITDIAFSPDGRWLATASTDGTAALQNLEQLDATGLYVFQGHLGAVRDLAFGRHSRWLATASQDTNIWVWPIDQEFLEDWGPVGKSARHAVPVDGAVARLATASMGMLGATRRPAGPPPEKRGQVLGYRGVIRLEEHRGEVTQLTVSADGQMLVSAGPDGTARVWGFDPPNPRARAVFRGDLFDVATADMSADGRWLAIGNRDGRVRRWSISDLERIGEPDEVKPHEPAYSVRLSGDGRRLVALTEAYDVWIHDFHSGETFVHANDHFISSEQLAREADVLFVTTEAPELLSWDLTRPGAEPRRADINRGMGEGFEVGVTPDGRHVANSNTRTTQWRDGTTLEVVWDIDAAIAPLLLSADGRRLVGFDDVLIGCWDIDAKERAWSMDGQMLDWIAISPDGRRVVSAGDDGLMYAWHVDDRELPPDRLIGHTSNVTSSIFLDDGARRLATGSDDGSVRVWDLDDEDPSKTAIVLGGLDSYDWIVALRLSADGREIVALTSDKIVYRWPLDVADLIDVAGTVVERNLTQDEWVRFLGNAPYRETFPDVVEH